MARATYDPKLPTNRDHVRLLIGDVNTADAELNDQEIDAVLSAETAGGAALKYFAAARCLELILAGKLSGGVTSKSVGSLSLSYGAGGIQGRIDTLRARGAFLLTPNCKVFRVVR